MIRTINNRVYKGVTIGVVIRGTISKEDPGDPSKSIPDKIFRLRPGHGYKAGDENDHYQDQYPWFVNAGIYNTKSEPYRRQWIAAVHKWKYDLTDSEKEAYNRRASKGLRMSGYNLFMREAMKGLVEMYIDRGDPAAYDYVKTDLVLNGTWQDLDLSLLVPAGAKAILLCSHIEGNAVDWRINFRKKGNTNEINHCGMDTLRANVERHRTSIVACDANRVIQYNADNQAWTTLDLAIRGWWT